MRARPMLSNVFLLSLPSLIVFFAICEFVIFRFVPITEPIRMRFDEQWSMVTLTPNRSGRFVWGLDRQIRYRSNAEGWNSLREYAAAKSDAIRIAVIGDSYVEAFNVDVENAFAEQLEAELSRRGHDMAVLDDWSPTMGALSGIVVDQESGALKAGADPRRDAYAIGR